MRMFFGRPDKQSAAPKGDWLTAEGLLHAAPEIHFENVSFSYPGGPAVIRNLSFEAPAGSAFGVVGPSGVGKSTLLALLMGVEVPEFGQIRLTAGDIQFDPTSHQLTIGYVGPEPFLIAGSVAENLLYGTLAAHSSDAMLQALKRAGFAGSHSELNAILNSMLTENGEGL